MNLPWAPGSWSVFTIWTTPVAVVCFALILVCAVLRYREWSELRFERAAAREALEPKVLDRRSSRVRAVEALTGAVEIVAVPIDATIIAEAPQSPDPEVTVLPVVKGRAR